MRDPVVGVAVLLLCSCGPAVDQDVAPDDDLQHRVDSLALATLQSGPIAGLAVAVARGGDRLIEKGYGLADIENDVPVAPGTVFRIGSITKQFTAAIVMQLVEESALELDDPISRFLVRSLKDVVSAL